MTPKLFLIDGMAIAYRAHFAFIKSRLQNKEGVATGPIFGFANTLVQLLDQEKPTHIAVAWDTHAPTFRHEMDESYKANRPPQPDELRVGIPIIKEMMDYFNIPNLELDGYEADDIIGTLAYEAAGEEVDVFMVTPDKDFMQLVTPNVKMYKPLNNAKGFQVVDEEGVVEYFGVKPEKVIDVLALIGDTSDNIPGVPGIGKKGAPKLIDEHGSVEKLVEIASTLKSKRVREGLLSNPEQALKSKEMVTIKTDVPDTVSWKTLEWKGGNASELAAFFDRMEFRTLKRRFSNENEPSPPKNGQRSLFDTDLTDAPSQASSEINRLNLETVSYECITTFEQLSSLVEEWSTCDRMSIDTETTGVDPISAEIVGISIAQEAGKAWYIPVNREGYLSLDSVISSLSALFQDTNRTWIAHNAKYDYIMLVRAGLNWKAGIFDTMIAAYLLDSSQKLSMDELSLKELNYQPVTITSLIGTGKKQKNMADLDPLEIVAYACEDADITLLLYQVLFPKMKEHDLKELAETIEFPLIKTLAHMEMEGVSIDVDLLGSFSKQLTSDIKELEAHIFEAAGETFNLNSTQQLGEILFDKLGLPSGKKTKTGKYSTSEQVLQALAPKYDFVAQILDYRSLAKLKSTYVDALPKLTNAESGRIHTNFNQHIAATGRLSSSNPNLQNIPIRTVRGKEIRRAFTAREGKVLISADYSQIELRVIASISKDEAMQEAFVLGEDIHARTAKEIFHLDSLDEVTSDHRRKAKEVNFGIPYGVSAYGLATRLGVENDEAKTLIKEYFNRFPRIREYINSTVQFAKDKGYVVTLNGRRRYIPDIHSRNFNIRGFAERTAINTPIQGTAADIIKIAMNRLHSDIEEGRLPAHMVLQVHDELLFEVEEAQAKMALEHIVKVMETAMDIGVPLTVEAGISNNWLEAH